MNSGVVKAEPMEKVLMLGRWSVVFGACRIASQNGGKADYISASTVTIVHQREEYYSFTVIASQNTY